MKLHVLRYFLAVCNEGSMLKAAKALHLTQPTLSRQIAALENELGCTLMERGGRRVELTEQGIYLKRKASEILELVEQTESDLRSQSGPLEGQLRIAAGESWAIGSLARVMREFREKNPLVTISIHSGNNEDIALRLEHGLADFAVFFSHGGIDEYSHVQFSLTDAFGILMPKDHLLSRKKAIRPSDLAGTPLLVPEEELVSRSFAKWLKDTSKKPEIIGTYSLAYNASMLVKEGLGCAVVFSKLVPSEANSEFDFRPLDPPLTNKIDLAWKKDQPLAPVSRAFLALLQNSSVIEPPPGLNGSILDLRIAP